MSNINRTIKSKKGRPPVDTEPVNLRLSRDTLNQLDLYRRWQDDLPTRPEAIRRLLAKALDEAISNKFQSGAEGTRPEDLNASNDD